MFALLLIVSEPALLFICQIYDWKHRVIFFLDIHASDDLR